LVVVILTATTALGDIMEYISLFFEFLLNFWFGVLWLFFTS